MSTLGLCTDPAGGACKTCGTRPGLRCPNSRLVAAQPAPMPVAPKGWAVRERRNAEGELLDCFVEAPREGDMPYALEVLGDDYTGYGDVDRKIEHCKLIVSLVNAALPLPAQQVQNS